MNNLKSGRKYELKDVEKLVKPKISLIILVTLVCFGPFGNLIFNVVTKDYDNLLLPALLTLPTLLIMSTFWCWYLYSLREYKILAKNIFDLTKKK